MDLSKQSLPEDTIGLLEGITTTRAIRRYRDEPVPDAILRDILFAATRGPSGSNRQPFRFLVLNDGDRSRQARELIADGARQLWGIKRERDQYDRGSGADNDSPKSRMARTMQDYVDQFAKVPCLILPCLQRYREPDEMEGASVYPAVQNLLLAARATGYGGVITGFHRMVEPQLRELLDIPEEVFIACPVTLGMPAGQHGPVRRRPLQEFVFSDRWGDSPDWATDPPGTNHTQAGPPRTR